VKAHQTGVASRGAPDPQFCYPAGCGSCRIRIQTSTTADNRRRITFFAPQLEETGM